MGSGPGIPWLKFFGPVQYPCRYVSVDPGPFITGTIRPFNVNIRSKLGLHIISHGRSETWNLPIDFRKEKGKREKERKKGAGVCLIASILIDSLNQTNV